MNELLNKEEMTDQVGDNPSESKFLHDFEIQPDNEYRNHKFTYPSMMEAQIRKLRQSLDSWREIVLHLKNVFIWEKHWHPTAILGGNTIFFTLLWLLDPSILTVVSLFGLFFTVCDYLVPSIASSLFKPEKWTIKKDKELEEFCTSVVLYRAKLELTWASYCKMKNNNRKMYFLVTVVVLSLLAWIGCTFNNLFLAYLLVTFLLLLPGMEHNGIISKWNSYMHSYLFEFVKQAKSKVGDEKED